MTGVPPGSHQEMDLLLDEAVGPTGTGLSDPDPQFDDASGNGTGSIAPSRGSWHFSLGAALALCAAVLAAPTGSSSSPVEGPEWVPTTDNPVTLATSGTVQPESPLAHDQVTLIRRNLGLTIVQLARVMGVSRQAVHGWVAVRSRPRREQARRLRQVAVVAPWWHSRNGAGARSYLRRTLSSGSTFVDLLSENPLDTAKIRAAIDEVAALRSSDRQLRDSRRSVLEVAAEHGFEEPTLATQRANLRRMLDRPPPS
jgi:DNA-binding transcriptional regulator YiaG